MTELPARNHSVRCAMSQSEPAICEKSRRGSATAATNVTPITATAPSCLSKVTQEQWPTGHKSSDRRLIGRRSAMNMDLTINADLAAIRIPDSGLAREITELVRDTEMPLLFHHSSRVYYWGALAGKRRGLRYDPELLYAGAMFHDMGLTHQHSSTDERFEVDSANAARAFLRSHGIAQQDIDTVWTAIALHTTPGIPQHMHPVLALVTAGVEMDVLGLNYAG